MTHREQTQAGESGWTYSFKAEHAGVMLTVGYLLLVLIGLLHESWVLLSFRVNILQYADPSDFVLAPARDPLLIVATIVPIGAGWMYYRATMRLSAKFKVTKSWWGSDRKTPTWVWVLMTVLWTVAISLYYSRYVADKIKAGKGRAVQVSYVVQPVVADTSTTYLVATTGRALFLYRLVGERTEIVPWNNVARMVVTRRAKAAR